MNDKSIEPLLSKARKANDEKLCPECGAGMDEVDRLYENGTTFVWYRCGKNNCAGQWLQKISTHPLEFGIIGSFAPRAQSYLGR